MPATGADATSSGASPATAHAADRKAWIIVLSPTQRAWPGRPPGFRNRQRANVYDLGRILATG